MSKARVQHFEIFYRSGPEAGLIIATLQPTILILLFRNKIPEVVFKTSYITRIYI